jgi:hypothetical protein
VAVQSSHLILYDMESASWKNQTLLKHFMGHLLRMKLFAELVAQISLDSIFFISHRKEPLLSYEGV